jgi:hypothetical protein
VSLSFKRNADLDQDLAVFQDIIDFGFRFLEEVQETIKKDERQCRFVNGIPGRSWFDRFKRQHPDVARRVAQAVSRSRAAVTWEGVAGWFTRTETYMKKTPQ